MISDLAAPSDEDGRRAWLALARAKGVGPLTFFALLRRAGGDVHEAAALAPRMMRGGVYEPAEEGRIAAELESGRRLGARLLLFGDADYPELLAFIPDPPPVLWVLGRADTLTERPCVALVGSRNASAAGRAFAQGLARDLGQARIVTVSGLARGIDTAAHKGALEAGTVAVVAGGLDVIYPPENADLQAAIAEEGAIVSERPFGAAPTARDFPKRNRIIAGLSAAVGVVEAAERSGSLITARLAIEQSREVLAAPGAPTDPRAAGCFKLLQDGAGLLLNADALIEAAAKTPRSGAPSPEPRLLETGEPTYDEEGARDEDEAGAGAHDNPMERVADLLSTTPTTPDVIARAAELSIAETSAILFELSLEGRADIAPDGAATRAVPQ